jgi:signal peptidase I
MTLRYKSLSWIVVLAVGALSALFIQTPVVSSGSMVPTLRPGQHLLVIRTPSIFSVFSRRSTQGLNRGDIVILLGPENDQHLVKRVIGLPGDRIHIDAGLLYLNGKATFEPYAYHGGSYIRDLDDWPADSLGIASREITVPPNMLFLMGDNRPASKDSRLWGSVPTSDVIGKVVLKLP